MEAKSKDINCLLGYYIILVCLNHLRLYKNVKSLKEVAFMAPILITDHVL